MPLLLCKVNSTGTQDPALGSLSKDLVRLLSILSWILNLSMPLALSCQHLSVLESHSFEEKTNKDCLTSSRKCSLLSIMAKLLYKPKPKPEQGLSFLQFCEG